MKFCLVTELMCSCVHGCSYVLLRKQQESTANARKQGKKSKKNSGEDCSPPAAKQPRMDGATAAAAAASASAEMPKASKSRSKRKRSGDRSDLLSRVFV